MAAHDGSHDEQPEAGAMDRAGHLHRDAIEAPEDALQLGARNTDAVVLHTQYGTIEVGCNHVHDDILLGASVLDGVIEEIGNGGAQLLAIAEDDDAVGGRRAERQRTGREMMPEGGQRRRNPPARADLRWPEAAPRLP